MCLRIQMWICFHVQERLKFDFGIEFLVAIANDAIKRCLRLACALFKFLTP